MSDQVCETAALLIAKGVLVVFEGMEVSPAHRTGTLFFERMISCPHCFRMNLSVLS